MKIDDIYSKYISDTVKSINSLGGGHINDTYVIDTARGRYICQRISRGIDTVKLEYNYNLYSKACDEYDWLYPAMLKTAEGDYFVTDEDGDKWRVYRCIEGGIINPPFKKDDLYACGVGLAKMHKILSTLTEEPKANYPHLHDLKYYYDIYLKMKNSDDICEENRDIFLESVIDNKFNEMPYYKAESTAVVHGDTKLANIILNKGEVVAFIDFDTIMMGSKLEDIADCVRSASLRDRTFDKTAAEILVDGYLNTAPEEVGDEVMKNLPDAFNKICFELGLRYYMDALSKEKVFKEKYPGFRIDNAKRLLSVSWE